MAAVTAKTAHSGWTGGVIGEVFRRDPLYAGAALFVAALIPPTLIALVLDQRTLFGANVWVKPLRFEVALAIYLATLAWFSGWLPPGVRGAMWWRAFSVAVVLSIAAELVWVVGAAAFGIASHFNVATPAMRKIYGLMGLLAVLLTSAALVQGLLILRFKGSGLAPAVRLAVGLGSILTCVLTVIIAGYMASRTGHSVERAGHAGGDLRVAHFFATHAMHFIPAFGVCAVPLLSPAAAGRAVIVFSLLFSSFVACTFIEALSGRPFLALAM